MKTVEELTAIVEQLEAASEQMMKHEQLAGRLAGVKSRYQQLGLPVPPEVDAAIADVTEAIEAKKVESAPIATPRE